MKVVAYSLWIISILVIVAFLRTVEQPGSAGLCAQEILIARQDLSANYRLHSEGAGLSGADVNVTCNQAFIGKYLGHEVQRGNVFKAVDLKAMPTLPAETEYRLIPIAEQDAFNTGMRVDVLGKTGPLCRSRPVLAVVKTSQWNAAVALDDGCKQALAAPQDLYAIPVK